VTPPTTPHPGFTSADPLRQVIAALRHTEPTTRHSAIVELTRRLSEPDSRDTAVEAVAWVLGHPHPDPSARWAVVRALDAVGAAMSAPMAVRTEINAHHQAFVTERAGALAGPLASAATTEPDPLVRGEVLRALAAFGRIAPGVAGTPALAAIRHAFADRSDGEAVHHGLLAAEVLGSGGADLAPTILTVALAPTRPELQALALRVILSVGVGSLVPPDAQIDALAAVAAGTSLRGANMNALRVLGALGDRALRATDTLVALLRDRTQQGAVLRVIAVETVRTMPGIAVAVRLALASALEETIPGTDELCEATAYTIGDYLSDPNTAEPTRAAYFALLDAALLRGPKASTLFAHVARTDTLRAELASRAPAFWNRMLAQVLTARGHTVRASEIARTAPVLAQIGRAIPASGITQLCRTCTGRGLTAFLPAILHGVAERPVADLPPDALQYLVMHPDTDVRTAGIGLARMVADTARTPAPTVRRGTTR
jgi:hypothetical protein